MGRYSDLVKNKINEIRLGLNEQEPNYLEDSSLISDYVSKQNGLVVQRDQVCELVLNDIRSLPNEQQLALYNEIVNEGERNRLTFDRFQTMFTPPGLLNRAFMKYDLGTIVEKVEELLPPERTNESVSKLENVVSPFDPKYPMERKVYHPFAQELSDLENAIAPEDPDAQHKRDIIARAADRLTYVRNEHLSILDRADKKTGIQNGGYTDFCSNLCDQATEDYFAQYGGGKLLDKLPHTNSERFGKPRIDMLDMGPTGGCRFNAEELEEFKNIKPEYSEELKQKAQDVADIMDQIGVEKFKNAQSTDVINGEVQFKSEQGVKMYGFWPLATAKTNLANAVKGGNFDEIEKACDEYDRIDQLTGRMMEIVNTGAGAYIGGNVNSTRPENGMKNPMPLKYVEDYVGHNRVNGMFQLYAFSKNSGKSVKEILDDPTKAASEIAEKFVEDHSYNKHKTLGAKLVHVRSGEDSAILGRDFDSQIKLLSRGMHGVIGLASTKEERCKVCGAVACAEGTAMNIVNTEVSRWNVMNDPADEITDAVYAQCILLPEDEVDLNEIGDKLLKDDWRRTLSVEDTVTRLRDQGKLDFDAIAERTDKILEEAEEEKENGPKCSTRFCATEFKLAAANAMKRTLACATPAERTTESYRKLQDKSVKLYNEAMAKKFAYCMTGNSLHNADFDNAEFGEPAEGYDTIGNLERGLRVQLSAKEGFFLSPNNSDEQKRMTRSQQMLALKLKQLRGDPFPESVPEDIRKQIVEGAVTRLAIDARNATYDYCRKKTDNGKDDTFKHETGRKRYEAALNSLDTIDSLIEGMDLGDPGERRRREIQTEVFKNCRDADWVEQHIVDMTAEQLYVSALSHKKFPMHKTDHMLEDRRKNPIIQNMKNSPAFMKLIENHSHQELAEMLVKGQGSLTNAFIKASNEATHNNLGPEPADMTIEEKREFMRDNVIELPH